MRLDLDLLAHDELSLDPISQRLSYSLEGDPEVREITSPTAVLFRAPTHLRESSGHRYAPEELLKRHQWAAFGRSLMVFEGAKWVNHPAATFAAECKPLQLATATALGFRVPRTVVANLLPAEWAAMSRVAVKALDTFMLRHEGSDLFFYTGVASPTELQGSELREMPVIIQEFLGDKRDVRVTVVGDACFFARTETIVEGDWRTQKDRIRFLRFEGDNDISTRCRALLRRFGLRYGAIDLVQVQDEFVFLELNPTGEWGWLEDVFDGQIGVAIANELMDNHAPHS